MLIRLLEAVGVVLLAALCFWLVGHIPGPEIIRWILDIVIALGALYAIVVLIFGAGRSRRLP
jgi:hypothetical protein